MCKLYSSSPDYFGTKSYVSDFFHSFGFAAHLLPLFFWTSYCVMISRCFNVSKMWNGKKTVVYTVSWGFCYTITTVTAWGNNQTCVFYTWGSTEVIFWGYWYCLELCRVVCLLQWLKGRVGQKKRKEKKHLRWAKSVNNLLFIWSVLTYAESLWLGWNMLIIMTEADHYQRRLPFVNIVIFDIPSLVNMLTRHLVWFQGWGCFEFFFFFFLVHFYIFIFCFCVYLLDCFLLVIELLQ